MSLSILRDIIEKRVTIPTLPAVVDRLNAVLENPSAGPREVAEVLAKDPALGSKVLRIANSAYYGLRQSVPTVERAAAVLGMDALRSLVLQSSVVESFQHLAEGPFDLEALWRHSILTARLADLIGKRASGPQVTILSDSLYTCGLLHDVGKIALFDTLEADYVQAIWRAEEQRIPPWQEEERVLGFTHCDVGALIALRWRLPVEVSLAIQSHHGKSIEASIGSEPLIAYVANEVAHSVETGDRRLLRLVQFRARRLGIDAASLLGIAQVGAEILPEIEI